MVISNRWSAVNTTTEYGLSITGYGASDWFASLEDFFEPRVRLSRLAF